MSGFERSEQTDTLFNRIRRRVMRYPRWFRTAAGIALIIGGFLGFLPILGFWMIPLGIVVLSYDIGWIRRRRRRFDVKFQRKWRARRARRAGKGEGRG